MSQQPKAVSVPLAHGGPITDETLASLISAAHALEEGTLDEIGGHFLIQNLAAALGELEQRRAVMGAIAAMADHPSNITVLAEHRS